MALDKSRTVAIGPHGEVLELDDVPAAETERWVPRRKAIVVAAVEAGLLTRDAALRQYQLSDEEYESWKTAWLRFGLRGLRVSKPRGRKTRSTGGDKEAAKTQRYR